MLSETIRLFSPELAARFDGIDAPPALSPPRGEDVMRIFGRSAPEAARPAPTEIVPDVPTCSPQSLADAPPRVALLVGPTALYEQSAVQELARTLGAPVANTWGAKGIYPWDDPHHMGTCGLQRDDFALLGFDDFDLVVAIGTDDAEMRPDVPPGARIEHFAGDLRQVPIPLAPRPLVPAGDNELFRRMSAIAQPGYVDDSFPRHPARAVIELKRSLGPSTRVTAAPGEVGLWIARTFPTDRPSSVLVPAHDRPGIGAAFGLVSAARGTDTVTVGHDPVDDVTHAFLELAARHELPLRLEVWGDDVDWSRTEDLIAAAGPVVAWT